MNVAVVSSVYGGYDERSAPPPQTIDVEWVCVTDVERDVPGWTVVVEPRPDMHPRLAAKVAKCLPWAYTNADLIVWMDGACQVLREDTVERLVVQLGGYPLAQFVHPWRDCVRDEAWASRGMLKYQDRPVIAQAEHYIGGGHPEHWGLWATGLIVYNARHPKLTEFGARWLAEQMRWTYQDQLSEAPLLKDMGLLVRELAGTLHGNGLVAWANHRDDL